VIAAVQRWLFAEEDRIALVAARIIVAAQALWILLSRPDLPSLTGWPREFWSPLGRPLLLRFGYFVLQPAGEWIAFVALLLLLVCVAAGVRTRDTALCAGLLLYHFAPLDDILIYADLSGLNGLTVPVFALFIIAAADWRSSSPKSSEYRWPVVLIQLLFALSILLAGVSKMLHSGPQWYTADSIRSFAAASWAFAQRPYALKIATGSRLPLAIAAGSAILDFSFVFMLFSRPLRWFVIPLALAGLLVRSSAFGLHWLAAPLLLLFVNWSWLRDRVI
jgi:hypothetical protein